jgi:Zn-dependent protease with chaperone function
MRTRIDRSLYLTVIVIAGIALLTSCAARQKAHIYTRQERPDYYATLQKCGRFVIPILDPDNIKRYKIGVVEAETPNAYISGYNIIFYDVILDDFPEDEVCGIFAHEVSHKALGHYSTKLVASQTTTQAMILLDRVVPGLGYLNYIINPLVTSFFSRELEVQADKTAVDTLIKAQRDPTAYLRALEHLDEWCVENGIKRDKGGPFADHPAMQERIATIREYIASK